MGTNLSERSLCFTCSSAIGSGGGSGGAEAGTPKPGGRPIGGGCPRVFITLMILPRSRSFQTLPRRVLFGWVKALVGTAGTAM